MPFDKLPSNDLKFPEFHPFIRPMRPISQVPEAIAAAVAKIADTLSPQNMVQNRLAKAQIAWMNQHPGQMYMSPKDQLALQVMGQNLTNKKLTATVLGQKIDKGGQAAAGGQDITSQLASKITPDVAKNLQTNQVVSAVHPDLHAQVAQPQLPPPSPDPVSVLYGGDQPNQPVSQDQNQ